MVEQPESEPRPVGELSHSSEPWVQVLWREVSQQENPGAAHELEALLRTRAPTFREYLAAFATVGFGQGLKRSGLAMGLWVACGAVCLLREWSLATFYLGLPVVWLVMGMLSSGMATVRALAEWRRGAQCTSWAWLLTRLGLAAGPWRAPMPFRPKRPSPSRLLTALEACRDTDAFARNVVRTVEDLSSRRRVGRLVASQVAAMLSGRAGSHEALAAQIVLARMGRRAALVAKEAYARRDQASRSQARLIREMVRRESRECRRTATRHTICGRCFVRPRPAVLEGQALAALLSGIPRIAWFGCPRCGSAEWLREWKGEIVCVVDGERHSTVTEEGGTVRVNWLERARRRGFEGEELFEFDRVEIRHATDTEVGHFLVDITSDTDRGRRKRHGGATCTVSRDCPLSENTLAALRSTFRDVTVR